MFYIQTLSPYWLSAWPVSNLISGVSDGSDYLVITFGGSMAVLDFHYLARLSRLFPQTPDCSCQFLAVPIVDLHLPKSPMSLVGRGLLPKNYGKLIDTEETLTVTQVSLPNDDLVDCGHICCL
jgi:hypothetical protein